MRIHSVSTVTANSVAVPSPEELVARARDLRPGLQSRSARCEDQCRIPQENLNEMIQAGLFNVLKPKDYGGYEMGWDSFCDIILEISAGCGALHPPCPGQFASRGKASPTPCSGECSRHERS